MLCDDWLARINAAAARRHATDEMKAHAQALSRSLAGAQRFAIAADAQRMLAELAAHTDRAALEKARALCIAPGQQTWVEWFCPLRQMRIGFFLESEVRSGPAVHGDGFVVLNALTKDGDRDIAYLPIAWSLPGPGPALTVDPRWLEAPGLKDDFPGVLDTLREDLVHVFVVAFALIASPRLTQRRDSDLSALNAKRRRMGRAALLEHSEILLALQPAPASEAPTDGLTAASTPRARHHVRAHYRFKRGKIEIVRDHMRGDERFGTVAQTFTLRSE
jgi:hypothetical protein